MTREELIELVVKKEWQMFRNVCNTGGRATCQDDPQTFEIMRSSQAVSWSDATLESYLDDLTQAEMNQRNLLMEKYARMMQSTSPSEYVAMEHLLPRLEADILPLIDKITVIVLAWAEELSIKYPYILRQGRPIHSCEDSSTQTSLETYLRAELATYSLRTLQLYYENVLKQVSQNVNGSELTFDHTVKWYGYQSLIDANQKLKAQAGWSVLEGNPDTFL